VKEKTAGKGIARDVAGVDHFVETAEHLLAGSGRPTIFELLIPRSPIARSGIPHPARSIFQSGTRKSGDPKVLEDRRGCVRSKSTRVVVIEGFMQLLRVSIRRKNCFCTVEATGVFSARVCFHPERANDVVEGAGTRGFV